MWKPASANGSNSEKDIWPKQRRYGPRLPRRLLPPRSTIEHSTTTRICPDLALLAAATGKLWLAAEIVSSDDHRTDTVVKKQVYEEIKIPRLWMIDPRYDNIEVYHSNEYGLILKSILAGREILSEKLLPDYDKLKYEKAAIPTEEYKKQLTQLLLGLAKVQEAIEK